MELRLLLAFLAGGAFVAWLFALLNVSLGAIFLFGTASILASIGALVP